MKKILTVLTALTLILTLVFSSLPGCAGKPAPPPPPGAEAALFVWRWQHNLPETDPMYFLAKQLAEDIKVGTAGRLVVTLLPQGTVSGNLEILDAVGKGTVEMGTTFDSQWGEKNPGFYLIGGLPGGMTAYESIVWLVEDEWAKRGGGWKLAENLYAKYNSKWLFWDMGTAQMDYLSKKPIKSLADYKGVKVRAAGLTAKILAQPEFGAIVSDQKEEGVYSALEKGTIDAAFVGGPAYNAALNLPKVTKYAGFPAMSGQRKAGGIIINLDQWNGLPDDIKAYLLWLCREKAVRNFAYKLNNDKDAFWAMKNAGVEPVVQDLETQKAWVNVSYRLMEEIAAKDAEFKKSWEIWKEIVTLIRPYMALQIPNFED